MNRIFILILLLSISSCLSNEESKAKKLIKEKYNAEEVRIHFPEEDIHDSLHHIVEIIVMNSKTLDQSNDVFEEGLFIAHQFFRSMKSNDEYSGVRVIVANPTKDSKFSGFSKSFFYERSLLLY